MCGTSAVGGMASWRQLTRSGFFVFRLAWERVRRRVGPSGPSAERGHQLTRGEGGRCGLAAAASYPRWDASLLRLASRPGPRRLPLLPQPSKQVET